MCVGSIEDFIVFMKEKGYWEDVLVLIIIVFNRDLVEIRVKVKVFGVRDFLIFFIIICEVIINFVLCLIIFMTI